ncbi:Alpha/Beta hydrolase protein [Mycena crocata]|nr:Alpha/Beta hydrolase protein [Mycena crocata]
MDHFPRMWCTTSVQIPSQLPVPLPIPLPTNQTVMSEDCAQWKLLLTFFVLVLNEACRHVQWFYGGGFEFGKAQDTEVRPMVEQSIVTGEPVIVVTPNYRVSAFGFLGGKEVNKAGISNLGLRDCESATVVLRPKVQYYDGEIQRFNRGKEIFVLEWVQEHIAAFAGDPERVVIGGFSAGGESTALLLLSNRRFDQSMLFRGVFMLSGCVIPIGSVQDGQPHYDDLVAANGCQGSQDSLECLQRVPFNKFIATLRIDGDVVAQNPSLSISQGAYARVICQLFLFFPILTANVDDDVSARATSNGKPANFNNHSFFALSNTNITYIPWATRAQTERVSELYPEDPTQGSPFNTGTENQLIPQFKRLAAFTGDYLFTVSKHDKSTPTLGAFHSSDVPMWFLPSNSTDTFAVDALINFINTLDPNGSSVGGKNNTQPN